MSAVASELRLLRREVVRLNRKLALSRISGKVREVREHEGAWQVRLDLGEDPASGDSVRSPWVRVQPASAGALKIKVRPTEGEQMYLVSASGVVGADSLAMWGAFDSDHPGPAGLEDVVIERGATRLILSDTAFEVAQDGVRLRLAQGKAEIISGGSVVEVAQGQIRSRADLIVADGEVRLGDADAIKRAVREDGSPAERVKLR